MIKPLNFAIVGCGKIAPRHAIEAVKYGRLKAVCDIVASKADRLAAQYNATAYYDLDSMLASEKELDILVICTPNGLHAGQGVSGLNNGLDILCEKPLCINREEGIALIEKAGKMQRRAFVVKSTRYNPILGALKNELERDGWGKIYSFQLNCFWNRPSAYYKDSWRGTSLDGGTLFTQFSHYIDALIWLLGDLATCTGYRKNLAHTDSIISEDTGVVAIEMKNGIIGGLNWSVNSYNRNMEVSLTLLAEKGSIRIGGEYLNKIDYQLTESEINTSELLNAANDYGFYQGSMSNHDKVYENLVKALADPSHPFTDAQEGLRTVEAIEMIYGSLPLYNQKHG
jgi:predicted dehydrogenase